ncbi:hypothetical protein LPJ53_004515, partial [Coemansia erecta]
EAATSEFDDFKQLPSGFKKILSQASDAPNYLEFLKKLRAKLPSDKSLSIAAPASYWYLKAFDIAEMSKCLDYIVYMTYDLHGQWDYGNKWTSPGCESGNCLRSHVNWTETVQTLNLTRTKPTKMQQMNYTM